jgi:glycosyltransferase involved in cell wall biosynthesis
VKISIITVCKNAEKHIEGAISSVLNQDYYDIEYIIVDGNSTDQTQQIISKYSKYITKFISESDRSLYEAMNKGIRLATGNFLYFLNSDDRLVDQNVIKDVINFILDNQSCDFIYGNVQTISNAGTVQIHKPVTPDLILEEMICLGNCPIQPAIFFKSNLFLKIGYFNQDDKIASDYEWFIRLLSHDSLQLKYYERTIVKYDRSGLSSNIYKLFAEVFAIQNKAEIYQSNYWLNKRVLKLQESLINTKKLILDTEELSSKRLEIITNLENSKIFKLQKIWQNLTKILSQIVKI